MNVHVVLQGLWMFRISKVGLVCKPVDIGEGRRSGRWAPALWPWCHGCHGMNEQTSVFNVSQWRSSLELPSGFIKNGNVKCPIFIEVWSTKSPMNLCSMASNIFQQAMFDDTGGYDVFKWVQVLQKTASDGEGQAGCPLQDLHLLLSSTLAIHWRDSIQTW